MATQAERTAATRRALLDATISCVVEKGWSATTTNEIADRAGVSRGARLHHFPSKADLVVAALEHLAAIRHEEIKAETPADLTAEKALRLLSKLFSGPFFIAWTELWVAARTDAVLHAALDRLEHSVAQGLFESAGQLLGLDTRDAEDRVTIQLTLEMLRGLGTAAILADPKAHARTERLLLRRWAATDLGRRPAALL